MGQCGCGEDLAEQDPNAVGVELEGVVVEADEIGGAVTESHCQPRSNCDRHLGPPTHMADPSGQPHRDQRNAGRSAHRVVDNAAVDHARQDAPVGLGGAADGESAFLGEIRSDVLQVWHARFSVRWRAIRRS